MEDEMSESTYSLWTIATAFGPVEQGYGDDKWRQLWKDRKVAQAWADHIQYAKFGPRRVKAMEK